MFVTISVDDNPPIIFNYKSLSTFSTSFSTSHFPLYCNGFLEFSGKLRKTAIQNSVFSTLRLFVYITEEIQCCLQILDASLHPVSQVVRESLPASCPAACHSLFLGFRQTETAAGRSSRQRYFSPYSCFMRRTTENGGA